jgi:hypothetical protein
VQQRSEVNAGLLLDGFLGDERRKTGWMRAEAAAAISVLAGNRRFWVAARGRPMLGPTSFANRTFVTR